MQATDHSRITSVWTVRGLTLRPTWIQSAGQLGRSSATPLERATTDSVQFVFERGRFYWTLNVDQHHTELEASVTGGK